MDLANKRETMALCADVAFASFMTGWHGVDIKRYSCHFKTYACLLAGNNYFYINFSAKERKKKEMKYTPAEVTNIKVGSFFVTVNKEHISPRRRWCSRPLSSPFPSRTLR